MKNKVVVTGGAGFIGSHLVDALIAQGKDVHVIDDLSNGQKERVPAAATLHTVDVSDAKALLSTASEIGRVSCWYHFAAQVDVRVSVDNPRRDAQVNILGTLAVLEAARRDNAIVVFASTGGAIYGEATPPTAESAPAQPESPYGASKLAAEGYVAQDARLNGVNHTIVRFANVYGPRQDPYGEGGVVAIFAGLALSGKAARIYGDGTQTRDFVYVGDVVDVSLAAAQAAISGEDKPLRTQGRVPCFNVGTGNETSVLELWAAMERTVGKELGVNFEPARSGELHRSALNADHARATLGVSINTSIDSGVKETVEWLRSERS